MARTDSAKIKQFKKPLNINLGMIFFGVIFIYLLVCIFLYFTTKHVAGYQVKTGSLFVDNVYTGMAIRDESLITSDYAGYLNYYVREGSYSYAYDETKIRELFSRAYQNGNETVTIKCSDVDVYQEVWSQLIAQQKVFHFLQSQEGTIAYTNNDSQRSITFWL